MQKFGLINIFVKYELLTSDFPQLFKTFRSNMVFYQVKLKHFKFRPNEHSNHSTTHLFP